ncbi:MAG: hypothetical protein K1Y02_03795 [Candidatus Hydrogenedentes bacterium]|nr:hypothetical protein [Candidatus Hydrogenedentota bacterium]
MPISKRLVLINTASSLATRLLTITVLIWLQQYLLKRVTPEEYSLLPVLYSIMMFAPLITTVLTGGLGRYLVEAYARSDDERVTRIVSTMFPILCAGGLAFLGAGWTIAWYIDHLVNISPELLWDARVMMALLIFSAAIRLPLSPFGMGLYVRQKFVLQNMIGVGTELFRLTLLFTLLYTAGDRVIWVIAASVGADMLNLAITQTVSRRLVPSLRLRRAYRDRTLAKEMVGFGGWNFVNGLFGAVLQSADPIVLNRFASAVDVSCFYLGSLPIRQFKSLYAGYSGAIEPVVISMHAMNQNDRLTELFIRMGRLSLWSSLFVAAPFMILGSDIFALYVGNAYGQAGVVSMLLFACFPMNYGNSILWPIASARAQLRCLAWRTALENSFNLGLTIYLVASLHLGAKGSALASVISVYLGHLLLWWPLAIRLLNMRLRRVLSETILPGTVPFLASVLLMLGLRACVASPQWTAVIVIAIAGATVYILCLVVLMKDNDRADVRRMIRSALRYRSETRKSTWSRNTEVSL